MKRILNILLSLLIIVSFSPHVSSQSDQKDLDQVKLAKQFIGTWKTEVAPDSVVILKITPIDGGAIFLQENNAKGKTYRTAAAVFGFSNDKKHLIFSTVWANGNTTQDIGRFVSDRLVIAERFNHDLKHARTYIEWEFLSADSFEWRGKWRGDGMNWSEEWFLTSTFTKVKE